MLNGDDTPLNVTGATLLAIPRRIVFEWDPRRDVQLFYGADGVAPPNYDLATFLRYEQVVPLEGLTLGPERENPQYRPPRQPWTEERPWLLWALIGLAAVVVGALIVRMMGQVAPPDDS